MKARHHILPIALAALLAGATLLPAAAPLVPSAEAGSRKQVRRHHSPRNKSQRKAPRS